MPRDLRLDPPIPALFPERDALLAAVRDADPADDLPALVYADWQDEHGQPEHAELIRVMVELGKIPKKDKALKEQRAKLIARMQELFKTSALTQLRSLNSSLWEFERGFIRDLSIEWRDSPPSFAFGPPDRIDLPAFLPFDKLPWLTIALDGRPTTALISSLDAPWLRRVTRLRLNLSDHSPGVFAPLIASKHLGGLQSFEMSYCAIAASELVNLHLAKSATGLRVLPLQQLQQCVREDGRKRATRKAFLAAVEQIVSSPRARQFTSFGDDIVEVDGPLAKVLLASRQLKNIHSFQYVFGKISDELADAFGERFERPTYLF